MQEVDLDAAQTAEVPEQPETPEQSGNPESLGEPESSGVQWGDWVKVWAQVVSTEPEGYGNYLVLMKSTTEDYQAYVRVDHVETNVGVPSFAEQCTVMTQIDLDGVRTAYLVCSKHHGHAGQHTNQEWAISWDPSDREDNLERG